MYENTKYVGNEEKNPQKLWACDVCHLSLIDMLTKLRKASDMHVEPTSKEMK
jgi:hypothetical protein